MLELDWYKIFDPLRKNINWYVYAKQQELLSISDLAQHMQEHNTPFSKGTIEGLLNDFVQCIHEQLLNGKSVKIDNLAIFRLAVESNAFKSPGEVSKETASLGVRAAAGDTGGDDKTQPAVKGVKLTAVATGKMMRKNISRKAKLGWTTEAVALMDEERRKAEENRESGKKAKQDGKKAKKG